MAASLDMLAYVASFYRSLNTPPYSDHTLVKNAPLAFAASHPQNRLAVELRSRFMSPVVDIDIRQPKDEATMMFYESHEANCLVKEYHRLPGAVGVRAVVLKDTDSATALDLSLWWLRRPSPRATSPALPVNLFCSAVETAVLDLSVMAQHVHLLSLTAEHCSALETIRLPPPTVARGPLRSLHLQDCEKLAAFVLADNRASLAANDPTLLPHLTTVELFHCDQFDFTAFLPYCPDMEVLRGFVPSDHMQNGLAALSGLRKLRTFEITYSKLSSLAGLEACLALETCEISECGGLEDVTPLAGLPKLTRVALTMTSISTIEPLMTCPSLEVLSISSSEQLERLPTFPAHCRLRDLDISYTTLSDLTPLSQCTALETIHINNCSELRDLGPVLALPWLKTIDFEEGVALEVLPAILFGKDMYLNDWHQARRFAGDYSKLETINFFDCASLESLSGLEGATRLTSAQFNRCPALHDLSALSDKLHLTSVDINACAVASVEWARTCPNLKNVGLDNLVHLVDLEPLLDGPSVMQIETLSLFDCPQISSVSLSHLGKLRALTALSCNAAALTTIEGLATCEHLRTLRLSRCLSLTGTLSAVSRLPALEVVEASDTGLSAVLPSLSSVAAGTTLFPALTKLGLVRSASLTAVTENVASDDGGALSVLPEGVVLFPKLDFFDGTMTPLSDVSVLAHCPALTRLSLSSCPQLTDLTAFFRTAQTCAGTCTEGPSSPSTGTVRLTDLDVSESGLTTFYAVSDEPSGDAEKLARWCTTQWNALASLNVHKCPLSEPSKAFVASLVSMFHLEEVSYAPGRYSAPATPKQTKMARCE